MTPSECKRWLLRQLWAEIEQWIFKRLMEEARQMEDHFKDSER